MKEASDAEESIPALLLSIGLKLLRLGYCACCLFALEAILHCAPYVPIVLRRVALLGAVLCFVFEFVLRVPGFPFWTAMTLPILCAALLLLRRAIRWAATAPE